MSVYATATVYCDGDESCPAKVEAGSILLARRRAEEQGWDCSSGHGVTDLCPKHKAGKDGKP